MDFGKVGIEDANASNSLEIIFLGSQACKNCFKVPGNGDGTLLAMRRW